ncbi:YjbQ family protein [Microbulbifer thermotolerans]|uniref:YjbQ family protein n=1 Tax=Microbulbifer thermotolerans TaxID=252514 RepID=A0AB35I0V6_MICTH|nr:YjbQ family protein [Microbulbifer thermotolerans]MCX2781238.1 YjbQ family protein [Microbulbifer thermotolerans]MCX2783431.1 YjbQ family protein [Microbulbifer thermotolerans]MCX2793465.1 YjbQ family protein [Microbulbifer thermotolerans]MCX2802883.1 YjbQ family protein [Microbulbifer thermotolerans]MCX2803733.1 YjbQ family protein [Microbulbifer thermotolerans]
MTCPQFIRHTSASLLIQENASPSVRVNLEHWLNRLAPEDHNPYPHTRDVS